MSISRYMIVFCCALAVIPIAEAKVHEFQLDNGLKLLVKEDHRAPVMVSQVWYRVGSSYEYNGITGVSHVLEHMMFKGTKAYPDDAFSKIISANGGQQNAFTSTDYTAYYQMMHKDHLPISFELEADRMRNLLIPKDEFLKELEVVKEERRLRTEDKPEALTYERFMAMALLSSPYRHPIIGWMDDLRTLNVDDLWAWYQKWYAPNNAIVVVVGDVQPDQVHQLARKYFAPLKPSTINAPKPQVEPEQSGMRRSVIKAPAKLPFMVMGYPVPVLATAEKAWEPYALAVLAAIMSGGDSARIQKQLVRGSGTALVASAYYDPYDRMANLFVLNGIPGTGFNVEQLEAALLEQVSMLQKEPVSETELDRVKAQVVASEVYARDSISRQANLIGSLEAVGLGWQAMDEYVDAIQAVTAQQVQQVAQKYLIEDRLSISRLDPQPITDHARPKPAVHGGRHGG